MFPTAQDHHRNMQTREKWQHESDADKPGADESGANEPGADPSASLMGRRSSTPWADDDTETELRPRGTLHRLGAAVWSPRTILDGVLLIALVAVLVGRRPGFLEGNLLDPSGDITGFAPRVARRIQSFSPDPSFVPSNPLEFFTHHVQDKWLSIVPKGLGYVKVLNPEKYKDLPTQLKGYSPGTFTTSVTHQLHCLHAIVDSWAGFASNQTERSENSGEWHLAHCFDYLRQSIMCCGDTALEGTQTTFPAGFVGSDGWDAKHVCKDYGQVKDYLEERRENDRIWI